jgi:hypothetical protein
MNMALNELDNPNKFICPFMNAGAQNALYSYSLLRPVLDIAA